MSPIFVPGPVNVDDPIVGDVGEQYSLVQRVLDELGDLSELTREPEVLSWLNRGVDRLPARAEKQADLVWAVGDTSVQLPADFVRFDRLDVRDGYASASTVRGRKLEFYDPLLVAGSGVLYYYGTFSPVPMIGPSGLPPIGDEAVVHYALSRFFRKLARSRADYRRYTTIVGQSGLDVNDLSALADAAHQDFLEARADLEDLEVSEPVTFYGG